MPQNFQNIIFFSQKSVSMLPALKFQVIRAILRKKEPSDRFFPIDYFFLQIVIQVIKELNLEGGINERRPFPLISFILNNSMSHGLSRQWINPPQVCDFSSYEFQQCYQNNSYSILNTDKQYHLNALISPININYSQNDKEYKMQTNEGGFYLSDSKDVEDYFYQEKPNSSQHGEDGQDGQDGSDGSDKEEEGDQNTGKQKKITKDKKKKKAKKNQYDKNIFANITAVVLKNLCSSTYRQEIKQYCQIKHVQFQEFHSYFLALEKSKKRLGTSDVSNLLNDPTLSIGIREVFSLFLVWFLSTEYPLYIQIQGKMQDKDKYLRYASKMMYIPSLLQEEYHTISCLTTKV